MCKRKRPKLLGSLPSSCLATISRDKAARHAPPNNVFNMSGFKGIAKSGWHPGGKDGGKESWRGDFKGINTVVS